MPGSVVVNDHREKAPAIVIENVKYYSRPPDLPLRRIRLTPDCIHIIYVPMFTSSTLT